MANYIRKLQELVEQQAQEIAALRSEVRDFRVYLSTNAKFGNRPVLTLDYDGIALGLSEPTERLDWIATSEAIARLRAIEDAGDKIALGIREE